MALPNVDYVQTALGFNRKTVRTMPRETLRMLWSRCAEMLDWDTSLKSEAEIKIEVEYLFGNPPYEFLCNGDSPFATWVTTAPTKRKRYNIHSRDSYTITRRSPNYRNFAATMVDEECRLYKPERALQDVGVSHCPYSPLEGEGEEIEMSYKRPIVFKKKCDREGIADADTHPQPEARIKLFHIRSGICVTGECGSLTQLPRCEGHSVRVSRTSIYPRSATGTIWVVPEDVRGFCDCTAAPVVFVKRRQ